MSKYIVEPEDIPGLVIDMRSMNPSVRAEARCKLIEAHVGLAFKEAASFEDDEALADAMWHLVLAVDRFAISGEHPEALVAYVHKAIKVAVFQHTRGRGRKRDRRLKSLESAGKHTTEDGTVWFDTDAVGGTGRLSKKSHSLRLDTYAPRMEMLELVSSSCEDELEKQTVELKAQGFSGKEAAQKLGISASQLSKTMTRLELRFGVQEKFLA